jgi:hypothetical protein
MRSNVALIAGAFLGASAGVLCLFAMSSPSHAVRPAAAVAASTSKKAATAPAAPARVASAAKSTPAATPKAASPAGNTVATNPNPNRATRNDASATVAAKASAARGAAPAGLVGLSGPAFTSKPGASQAANQVASAAPAEDDSEKTAAPITNRVQHGISGFIAGVDIVHPVHVSGPAGAKLALGHGLKPAAGAAN